MRSAAVKAKGPGRGKGYGQNHWRGRTSSTPLVAVDSYMAMAALRLPMQTPPVPRKKRWNRQSAAGCRPPEPRFLDTSPYTGVFLRMCQDHSLPLNDDLRCPKGHYCTGDKHWKVQHALTGAVLYVDCSVEVGGEVPTDSVSDYL